MTLTNSTVGLTYSNGPSDWGQATCFFAAPIPYFTPKCSGSSSSNLVGDYKVYAVYVVSNRLVLVRFVHEHVVHFFLA